jgi:prepilin-type N-terminal cleavage/methylation domain-containing protein
MEQTTRKSRENSVASRGKLHSNAMNVAWSGSRRRETQLHRLRRGFTLAEIMITVSIIGIITAVALPNFFRLREEVNMEMVRGNLKVIHEAMNEFLNNNGFFPLDIFTFGEDDGDERAAIAANLTAIDLKEFDSTYQITDGSFFLRSCSRTLGRCFGTDPLGVHVLSRFDGRGVPLALLASEVSQGNGFEFENNIFTEFLEDPNLSDTQKIEIIANTFLSEALDRDLERGLYTQTNPFFMPVGQTFSNPEKLPISDFFYMNKNVESQFSGYMNEVDKILQSNGVQMYQRDADVARAAQTGYIGGFRVEGLVKAKHFLQANQDVQAIEVAYELDDPVDTSEENEERQAKVGETLWDWREGHITG